MVDDTPAWCSPIYPSREDVLTRDTKIQIITHNETWETLHNARK